MYSSPAVHANIDRLTLYTYMDAYFSLSSGVTEGARLDKALSISACLILIFSVNNGF